MTKHVPIHVVGGGLAGLSAAITAAESGAPVVLHEASDVLGGRARSGVGPYGVNLGPHVLFAKGAVVRFLRAHGMRRSVRLNLPLATRVTVLDGRGGHGALRLASLVRALALPRTAPADQRFDEWAHATFTTHEADDLCHLAGLCTFHHDPGSLSAASVWDGCMRSIGRPHNVRYVGGGWSSLVDAFATAARQRGVQIELGARLEPGELPDDGPVIVATAPRAASRLLDRDLAWPTARTALLDVALAEPGRMPWIVFDLAPDLGGCCMAERFTAVDRSIAPRGVELVQAQLGVAPDTELDDAVPRIERTLDGFGPWREAEVWRRADLLEGATPPADPPGTTWRDRPAIDQGGGRYLAGDCTAAPGLLSEVAVNSGVRAAHLALEERRQRQWAPGWPTVELTAGARARVLAAANPGSTVQVTTTTAPRDDAWTEEPVAEAEAWRTRTTTRRSAHIRAAEPAVDGSTVVTTVRVPRRT